MKLIWFNSKVENGVRTTDFGCLWPFFLILAAVIALIVWLV